MADSHLPSPSHGHLPLDVTGLAMRGSRGVGAVRSEWTRALPGRVVFLPRGQTRSIRESSRAFALARVREGVVSWPLLSGDIRCISGPGGRRVAPKSAT